MCHSFFVLHLYCKSILKEYEMKFKMIFDISIYYNGENLLADLEDDIHFDLKQHRIISTYKQNHPAKC